MLVDIGTNWCGHCAAARPLIAGALEDHPGVRHVKVEDGSEASPHGIAHDLGRDMHENPEKYIGQWAEFKYMERDRQGGYRHPVFYRLREAKA